MSVTTRASKGSPLTWAEMDANFDLIEVNTPPTTPEFWGAVGDGTTDDGAAFILACNHCSTSGATLRCSPKNYKNARIEVHNTYCVEGNGATVMYLGVGQTIIAGTGTGTSAVPTAWPTDAGYSPSIPATTMYTLTVAPAVNDMTLTLSSASGIVAGMYLFVAGNPSSLSSVNNYIPQDFEFVLVKSVASNVVTLSEPILSNYLTTQSGVFYTPGMAINCAVSNLTVNTSTDAYQHVVRSSYGCSIKNIIFAGTNAVGASTFSAGLRYGNIIVTGAYGAPSTGRGIVSVAFDGVLWNRVNGVAQTLALFVEESFYRIDINNYIANGGLFGMSSIDMGTGQRNRLLTVSKSMFDASTAYGGSTSPLMIGVCIGADIVFRDSLFKGSVVTPNSSFYPSITGTALIWQSNNGAGDSIKFANCKLISSNAGTVWPSAIGGFGGSVQFDDLCTFTTCTNNKGQNGMVFGKTPAAGTTSQFLNDYEEGWWVPEISFLVPGDLALTSTTNYGSYTRMGRLVTLFYSIITTPTFTTSSGYLKITGMPFTPVGFTKGGAVGEWTGFTAAGYTFMGCRAADATAFLVGVLSGSGQSAVLVGTTHMPSGTPKYLSGQISFEM